MSRIRLRILRLPVTVTIFGAMVACFKSSLSNAVSVFFGTCSPSCCCTSHYYPDPTHYQLHMFGNSMFLIRTFFGQIQGLLAAHNHSLRKFWDANCHHSRNHIRTTTSQWSSIAGQQTTHTHTTGHTHQRNRGHIQKPTNQTQLANSRPHCLKTRLNRHGLKASVRTFRESPCTSWIRSGAGKLQCG